MCHRVKAKDWNSQYWNTHPVLINMLSVDLLCCLENFIIYTTYKKINSGHCVVLPNGGVRTTYGVGAVGDMPLDRSSLDRIPVDRSPIRPKMNLSH